MSLLLALKELRNNRRFSLLFVANLSIGLFGFVCLDGFKRSFEKVLYDNSRNILSADLSISARRPISETEQNDVLSNLGPEVEKQNVMTLYSMAYAPKSARTQLVELKAIEPPYPFYGSITLRKRGVVQSKDPKTITDEKLVWIAPEILLALGLEVGDSIKLGEVAFKIDDIIEDDTSMSFGNATLAPRLYLGLSQLEQTGLIQEGSTAWRRIYYKLPPDRDPQLAETQLMKALESPSLRIRSHISAGENQGRLLSYLTDYLGLVSLVAFFLSGLGAIYLFRGYLIQKHREIATLLCLGMTHVEAVLTYTWQILLLGTVSASLSSLAGWLILPMTAELIKEFTPISFTPVFSFETVSLALIMGGIGTLLLCIPLLGYIRKVRPRSLFQEVYQPKLDTSWQTYLLSTPALLGFYGLSVWQAHSWLVGSLFFGLLIGSSIILAGCAWLGLFGLRHIKTGNLSSRLALRYLQANRVHAIACFLALSVGSLLINLIPQVRKSLLTELEQPSGITIPSLFLFDIQDSQKDSLVGIAKESGFELNGISPMILGRLLKVNGSPVKIDEESDQFSREAEQSRRMRNRGVNLSYRTELASSEEIVAGRPFSGTYDWTQKKPAEVSLEERYAERMELKIGDQLIFEVQGLEIDTEVVNLRRIKWNSFQPNFFIQLQAGVLEDAPKTFLASIPPLSDEEKQVFQTTIVQKFPNISVIDVSRLVEKLSESITQMSWILQLMAWISIGAGMVVVFSIAIHQAQTRKWEVNLLKILGASFGDIQTTILKEFAILSIAAGLLGGLLGLVVSYFLTLALFDGIWRPDLITPLLCLLMITIACVIIARFATQSTLRLKPAWVVEDAN